MVFSSRAEAFPFGLHVLVVDDDPTWLKLLEKMLIKCSYKVTTCGLAKVALDLLRERREMFDIVITDVNMPDMDGFKLLEQLGLEMDLPVIMMSVDGETSRVMKGVQHGACDYLLKPIRMKELRNIWQHVYRKKIHEVQEMEAHDTTKAIQMYKHCSEHVSQVSSGVDFYSFKKRKDLESKENSDQDCSDSSNAKKARVVWSVDLHQKFVNAVNQIGFDKIRPKKILDLMNIPGITRENVASHLQKYRLYLSRLQEKQLHSEFNLKAPRIYVPSTTQKVKPETMNTTKVNVNEIKTMIPLHIQNQIFQNQSYISEEKTTKSMSTCTVEPVSVTSSQNFEPHETEFVALHEDLQLGSLENIGFDDMDIFQYNDSTTYLTDIYSNWCDGLEFSYGNSYDQMEHPIMDDCLFV